MVVSPGCKRKGKGGCVFVEMPAQSNALTASTFFVATLVADALTAVDSTDHANVPASLRATSLVLVCCFAAPVLIRPERGVYGWFQRPVIGTALLVVALLGVHHGGQGTRTFDALYITVVCLAATWLFSAGGVDEQTKDFAKGDGLDRAVSTSSAMLAGALLLYCNMRILRSGLQHPVEVRNFRVSPTGLHNASSIINTLGYAYASDAATMAVSFGGAVGMGAAITMVYHVTELASGTDTVALQLGVSATFQALAALMASLTYGSQVDWLPAVFGDSACKAASDACEAAATSRRFASVNTQVPGLWLSSLGLFSLAYPVSLRFYNRSEAVRFAWSSEGSLFGIISLSIALLFVWSYTDFAGPGGHTDFIFLISVIAIFWSTFFDTAFGTLIYVTAFVWEEALYVEAYGIRSLFSHLTHITLLFCASLLMLHFLLTLVAFFYPRAWLERFLGTVTVAGSSLAVALYLASACLLMATNGSLGELQDTEDGSRFAIAFTYQHFLPVFVWAPLFTCRCEVQLLSRMQRLLTWFGAVVVDLALYAVVLSVLGEAPPTMALLDFYSLAGCVFGAGILPWAALSSI